MGRGLRDAKGAGPREGLAREIGTRIRARRELLGLTQTQAGAPYPAAYVSQLEHGRNVPSLEALCKIARNLRTSPAELIGTADQLEDASAALTTALVQVQLELPRARGARRDALAAAELLLKAVLPKIVGDLENN